MSILDQNKNFEFYHERSFEQTVAVLGKLREFVLQNELNTLDSKDSFWSLLVLVSDPELLNEETNLDLAMEKFIINLFDVDEAKRLVKKIEQWFSSLDLPLSGFNQSITPVKLPTSLIESNLPAELKRKISGLGFGYFMDNKLKDKYLSLSPEKQASFSHNLSELEAGVSDLNFQLELIASFMRLSGNIPIYSKGELSKNILSEAETVDKKTKLRLAYSLSNFMYYDEGKDVADVVYEYLRIIEIQKKEKYIWEDAFFMTIYLYYSFHFFHRYHWSRQQFWLMNYLIKALAAGIPVRNILESELYYETNNTLDYVTYNTVFYEAFALNREILPLKKIEDAYFSVREVIKSYFSKLGDKFEDGYLREEFIDGLVGNSPAKDLLKRLLREFFYIYCHLKTVNLIEKNSGSVATESEIYNHHLERLLVWWIDGELWNLIIKYYTEREDKRYVPLQDFLQQIRKNEDLNLDDNVEKLLKFGAFLQEHKILNEKENLLEFHEEDGQFHWNKELLV